MSEYQSKQHQDRFVDAVLNKPDRGYFLDFGAYKPVYANNTYVFERRGWDGVSFELQKQLQIEWVKHRKTECVYADVTKLDIPTELSTRGVPSLVDYLTVDVDAATLSCLSDIPFDTITFKVMTVEHDFYRTPELREPIREILSSHGYEMVCSDVLLKKDGKPFEDWWVNPDLVDLDNYTKFVSHGKYWGDIIS